LEAWNIRSIIALVQELLDELERRRTRMGLGHNAFAAELGCKPSTWSRARRGVTRVSGRVILAALERFPELASRGVSETRREE
jgi:hypothetical protein